MVVYEIRVVVFTNQNVDFAVQMLVLTFFKDVNLYV